MVHSKKLAVIISITFLSILSGCRFEAPDQTIIKPEHDEIAHPPPVAVDAQGQAKDFEALNRQHKILMAIFDTGIDYNHPQLQKNVHFDLDPITHKPIGLGKDYLAPMIDSETGYYWDPVNKVAVKGAKRPFDYAHWGSYHIVDTDFYDFKSLSKEKRDRILRSSTEERYNEDIHDAIKQNECFTKGLLRADPRLSKYINLYRADDIEGENIHGTHVAGLMTYDRPDFGLTAYRILPYHQTEEDKRNQNLGKADRFAENFADAVEDAAKKGVKIVNLSVGGSFERPDNDESANDKRNLEKFNNYMKVLNGVLTTAMQKHPEMLFIAAAGNDSGWSDNRTRVQYPCGIEADNILCVGAVNKTNEKTTFTNIPLNEIDLVFTPGFHIKSLAPSDRCKNIDRFVELFLMDGANGPGVCHYNHQKDQWEINEKALTMKTEMIKNLYGICSDETNHYTFMSGTSMATPIASHIAAEIWVDHPEITFARDIIKLMKEKSQAAVNKKNGFNFYRIDAKKPSWYGQNDEFTKPGQALLGNKNGEGSGNEIKLRELRKLLSQFPENNKRHRHLMPAPPLPNMHLTMGTED